MAKQRKNPDGRLRMAINGHTMEGTHGIHGWSFLCPSWPELAAKHMGDTDAEPMIEEFTRRALAVSFGVKAAFAWIQRLEE